MTTTPTTPSLPPAARVIVAMVGNLYTLRMETHRHHWDAELDMGESELLAMARVCGTALRNEVDPGRIPPGWTPVCGPVDLLLPPELAPAAADALHARILDAIHAGFDAANGCQ